MNRILKTTALMMGAGMMMGGVYYMMLPAQKKEDIMCKAKKMLKADENFMSSFIK